MNDTNSVAYLFWLPFYGFLYLVKGLTLLPLWATAVILLAVTLGILFSTLVEAGPMKIAVLARRFSWAGIPITGFIVWWVWCSLLFYRDRTQSARAVCLSGFMFVGLASFVLFLCEVIVMGKLRKGFLLRGYRRMRLRLRWDSIARSAGMSHERDVRPYRWWLGGTTITRLRAKAVQWTPLLWHGRASLDEDCTQYLLRPARGLTDKAWTDKVELNAQAARAIAIAANAEMVTITAALDKRGKRRRNWWRLNVYWTDPSNNRPELG